MDVSELVPLFPIALLGSWVTSRLLGVRQSWLRIITVGIAAGLLGAVAAVKLTDEEGTFERLAVQLFLTALFMLTLQGLLEFIKRPDLRERTRRDHVLPHPIRALWAKWLRSRRYSQLVRIALKNGFGPHLGRHRRRNDTPGGENSYGHRLRLTLEESGGAFVKLGQMLSTRSDLFPPDVVNELSRLQDDVAPVPPEAITALVEQEIDRPLTSVFLRFDTEPIGAASIGQVHAARLIDGRQVVVKVQRPGIDKLIERDLEAMLRFAMTIERRATWARSYQVGALAEEFADRLREELDYRMEASNTSALARNLDAASDVHIPVVHEDLTTRRVLTLERLQGVSIREREQIERRGFDRQEIADRLLRCYLRQLLIDGVYHADPHPGNIFLLEDGQIGLIDFGAIGHLDAVQQEALKDVLLGIGRRDPEAVLTALLDVVDIPAYTDLGRLQHALASFLARHATDTSTPSVGAFTALLRIFSDFGVYVPPEFSTLVRALATFQSTIGTLSPGYAFPERLEKIAVELFRDSATNTTAAQGIVKSELARTLPQLRRLPRHLDRIATLAQRGDLRLRVSLFTDETDIGTVTRLVNRVVLAGLGIGIAIVAVAILRTPGGPDLGGGLRMYPLLGYVGLLTSLVFIARVSVAVMRDGLN
jgi:ubiquinone biosynthesis protein